MERVNVQKVPFSTPTNSAIHQLQSRNWTEEKVEGTEEKKIDSGTNTELKPKLSHNLANISILAPKAVEGENFQSPMITRKSSYLSEAGNLFTLPGNARENSQLFRQEIQQFKRENSPQHIAAKQEQLHNNSAPKAKVTQKDDGHTLRRCGSSPAFSPPIGRKTTNLKGTYGKFKVEHGLDKKPTASDYGEYYIKIEMNPNSKTKGSTIGFLQTVRRGTAAGNWSSKATDPGMTKERAARTTKEGWRVDRANPAKDKTPLYGMKKNKAGKVVSRGNANMGEYKGSKPWMYDIPSVLDPTAMEFVATAIDVSSGTSYGAVFWGFEYDSSSNHYQEVTPALVSQGDAKLKGRDEAIEKWNKSVATPGSGIDQAPTIKD